MCTRFYFLLHFSLIRSQMGVVCHEGETGVQERLDDHSKVRRGEVMDCFPDVV